MSPQAEVPIAADGCLEEDRTTPPPRMRMWVFPDLRNADEYTYMHWVFPAVVAGFADEEAQLEVERYDEVDELRTKEDKGCVRQLYRKKWWKMD